jgi:hypothetical protein
MKREVQVVGNVATVKLKWFRMHQNNSGGSYTVDDFQAEHVFIQAATWEEAHARVWDMLDHCYCECCGTRWSSWGPSDEGDYPILYGENVFDKGESWCDGDEARLHFYDGRVEGFVIGEQPNDFICDFFGLPKQPKIEG